MPIAMATTVSKSVRSRPSRMRCEKNQSPTTFHSNRPVRTAPCCLCENAIVWTGIATSTAMTAVATQRPGWRTGTTFVAVPDGVLTVGSADGAVDLRVGDGAALDAPLGQDLLVGPVLEQVLKCSQNRVVETAAL